MEVIKYQVEMSVGNLRKKSKIVQHFFKNLAKDLKSLKVWISLNNGYETCETCT